MENTAPKSPKQAPLLLSTTSVSAYECFKAPIPE